MNTILTKKFKIQYYFKINKRKTNCKQIKSAQQAENLTYGLPDM